MQLVGVVLASFGVKIANSLNPITIKGSKLFDSVTGNQFYIRGVAYQPGANSVDPLSSPQECQRDAKIMSELGINTIRVYQIDTNNNHDECMRIFSNHNIYLTLDLATSKYSINRDSPEYTTELLQHYKTSVDAFRYYNNTMLFYVGNEVNNNKLNTNANPFVKALMRDIKKYLRSKGNRYIPVGYSTNDDVEINDNIRKYFNCGDSPNDRADFLAINMYRWCGKQTFEQSGLKQVTSVFFNYSIPAFFSEYGCNIVVPRVFDITTSLYNEDMSGVFNGGIVYEYTQEANNYGLVKINPNGNVEKLQDYFNLKSKLAASISPTKLNLVDYSPAYTVHEQCPHRSSLWQASNKLPPTPSVNNCECMMQALECQISDNFLIENNSKVGGMFMYFCSNGASCSLINQDGINGEYGAWAQCSVRQKLSFVANQVYIKNNRNPNACYNDLQRTTPTKQLSQCNEVGAEQGRSF